MIGEFLRLVGPGAAGRSDHRLGRWSAGSEEGKCARFAAVERFAEPRDGTNRAPNDPRGSWSDFVYSWELARFGRATKSIERTEVNPARYARWRDAARRSLKYAAVTLSGRVYLDTEEAVEDAIRYVEENPLREGKRRQQWSFVTPFAGIPKAGWTTYH